MPCFEVCLRIYYHIKYQRDLDDTDEKIAEYINSFVSMGGNRNKTGTVQKKVILQFFKQFGLTPDIEKILNKDIEDLDF